jgi:hypothetical protein
MGEAACSSRIPLAGSPTLVAIIPWAALIARALTTTETKRA